jgi:hypothetical protein
VNEGSGAHGAADEWPRGRRARLACGVALVLVALLPFVIAIVVRAGRDDLLVGDYALMDLRVRDVWSSDIPLVGAYSRFGWNHPGPAVFYGIAAVSGPFGAPPWATTVGSILLQGLSVLAIALVAWRTGGLARLVTALAFVGLAYGATGPSMVLNVWNPNVAFPLFMLFVLLTWLLATGHPRALLGVALGASLLVQAHVGYLPLVAAAGLCAVAFGIARVGPTWERWRRTVVWTGVGVMVVWIPAIVNELVNGSNVRAIAASLRDPPERPLGASRAAGVFAEEFRVPPPWLGGHHRLDEFAGTVVGRSAWWLAVPVVLLAAAAVTTWIRRRHGSVELLALTVTLAVVGFVSLTRVTGLAEQYVFFWRVPIALLIVFTSGWCVWIAIGADANVRARRAAGIALAGVVVFASAALSANIVATHEPDDLERVTQDALAAVTPDADPSTPVLVRAADTPRHGIQRAIVNELERGNLPVKVDEGFGFMFGDSREARPEEVDEVWYVAESGQYLSLLAGLPGADVRWNASPLDADDEAELQAGQRELWAALQEAGRPELFPSLQSPLVAFPLGDIEGVDPATLERVAALNAVVAEEGYCRCGIVAFDPAAAERVQPLIPPST